MNKVLAIVGPTAVGKSRLALHLAQVFDGEIVSADSRQVYRHMDIGTAKPSPEEQALVCHHLIDVVEPGESFSLAQYQGLAYSAMDDIHRRKKLPLLVGGSGLYVWTVLDGWQIPRVEPDVSFRKSLEQRAARGEADELYRELTELAPSVAVKIDRRNVRRVIRALEVAKFGAIPAMQKRTPPFQTLIIGLTTARSELYRRIDCRVDAMLKQGLVEEVTKLTDMCYNLDLPAMSGIGYRQIGMVLKGELTLEEAVQRIKYETHRYVRQQYNWFRLTDSRIKWFDVNKNADLEIIERVAEFLGSAD